MFLWCSGVRSPYYSNSYLGLTMDFSVQGEVRVTQEAYVDDLLEECGVEGVSKTPASEDLFDVREDATKSTTEEGI